MHGRHCPFMKPYSCIYTLDDMAVLLVHSLYFKKTIMEIGYNLDRICVDVYQPRVFDGHASHSTTRVPSHVQNERAYVPPDAAHSASNSASSTPLCSSVSKSWSSSAGAVEADENCGTDRLVWRYRGTSEPQTAMGAPTLQGSDPLLGMRFSRSKRLRA